MVTSARRSIDFNVVAWVVLGVVAATASSGTLLEGNGLLLPAVGAVVAVAGIDALVSMTRWHIIEPGFGSVPALPLLMVPLAAAITSPTGRVLMMAAASLGPVACVWWVERVNAGRYRGVLIAVSLASASMVLVDVFYRDPYHELQCHPLCPRNPVVLQHSRTAIDFTQWVVLISVMAWLAVNIGPLLRARRPWSVRCAAGVVSAVAVTSAVNLVQREDRSPSSDAAQKWMIALLLALSLGLSLRLEPALRQVTGRRRVRRWVTMIRETSQSGTVLEGLRDVAGDSTLLFAVDGTPSRERARTELRRGNRVVAVLEHSQRSSERLRAALTPPVIAALENEMLLSTATKQLDELRSARRLVVARGDQTRRRLERDLHDGAQQRLLALGLHLGRLADHAKGSERGELGAAVEHAASALVKLRQLTHGAVPPVLQDAGLHEALTSLAEETPVALVMDIDAIAGRRFDAELERAAHRLVAGSAIDAFNAGAPDLMVSATLTPVLTIRTQYSSDHVRARLEDEDRIGAAGGQLVSTQQAGTVIHEARFE